MEKSDNYPDFQEQRQDSKLDCENHRRTSLVSVPSKTFMRLMLNKFKPQREEQAGFRGGRPTIEQILPIGQILEKKWKYALPIYCSVMNLEKTYYLAWRYGMWRIAEFYGVLTKLVALLMS